MLKSGGKLIFHTPNKFGYTTLLARMIPEFIKKKLVYFLQGRKEEDVFPTYYRINSRSQIARLADLSGFYVLKLRMVCSSATLIILPPIVLLELIWIRFLMLRAGRPLRTNIIAILQKD